MSERPMPPVPPECSLRGHDYFQFYFDRLRKSKWWRRASDTARARNVMMWGEAYKSAPAGSLPDDDDELAEAAGYGMDVDAFLAVKADIMAPWVLCSDGRWYHPTLCEVVMEAWERTSDRRKKDAERKRSQREKSHATKVSPAPVRTEKAHVTRDNVDVPADVATEPCVSAIRKEMKGEEKTVEEANASLSAEADAPLSVRISEEPTKAPEEPSPKYPPAFDDAWKAYPHVRGRSSKPKALGYWRRLPAATRDALPSAIARYAREGREPKADCGAPAMDRWLRDSKFEDWMAEAQPKASVVSLRSYAKPSGDWYEQQKALMDEFDPLAKEA